MSVKHGDIFRLFARILPNEELVYHSPLPPHRHYDPLKTNFIASKLILSLTPTEGVYAALSAEPRQRCVLFLHRPFRLDRRRVPHGTLVLASHVRYDELLTTGWNEALANEHNVRPHYLESEQPTRICLKGYKNDPERRIGLVGLLSYPVSASLYVKQLSEVFGGHEYTSLTSGPEGEQLATESSISVLASLNAFTPEIVDSVKEAALQLGSAPEHVLCLTGAAREAGIEVASAAGMIILAVGHRRCETWGLEYLERMVRKAMPELQTFIVDEPEEPVKREQPKKQGDTMAVKDSSTA